RRLSDRSREIISRLNPPTASPDVALIVADGLSAVAAAEQSLKILQKLLPILSAGRITVGPVCVVKNSRVAIEDEIGEMLHATAALILLGERPGLGTSDSLGVYLVYQPRVGKT